MRAQDGDIGGATALGSGVIDKDYGAAFRLETFLSQPERSCNLQGHENEPTRT